jgi:uncharacterized protein GlcG (DUF336 family)
MRVSIGRKLTGLARKILILTAAMAISVAPSKSHAHAVSNPSLSAVNEAIRVCGEKGFKVTVTVVDLDGIVKVQARSDGSPIHSQQFSFRKAYTMVSMGPMLGVDTSSALVRALSASPQGLTNVQSGSTPLLFLPGAALMRSGKTDIGAIGVSGAPSSFEDEVCALSGVAKIQNELDAKL